MPESKLVIGLTGSIGSGKTAAAQFFSQLGVSIIDADLAAREVVEPGQAALEELVSHFGHRILNTTDSQATLNRQILRSIIFSDPVELDWLNNFMHPLIRNWMVKETALASSSYVIKVIPLLTETLLQQQVDRILVIDVPVETQIQRVTIRDNTTSKDIELILKAQSTREHRLSVCNDVIKNNSSLDDLEIAVKKMHNKYLRLAEEYNDQ